MGCDPSDLLLDPFRSTDKPAYGKGNVPNQEPVLALVRRTRDFPTMQTGSKEVTDRYRDVHPAAEATWHNAAGTGPSWTNAAFSSREHFDEEAS
jgi:hypothetical protein